MAMALFERIFAGHEFGEPFFRLCAFGFVFSLNLFNFTGTLMRGAGLLFALFYSYCIYGIMHAWIARAAHGTPFR